MILLTPVAAHELHEQWTWIRDGLLACREKCSERWLPEDIYAALKSASAFLFVIEAEGSELGFVILQQHHDPDGPVLFIWVISGENQLAPHEDDIYVALEEKARAIKAKRIRMQTTRNGWGACAYWTRAAILYEHELGDST